MNLSTHFSLEEFTASQTASRLGLDNTPPPEVQSRLKNTAMGLEAVRILLGAPIIVNSGYRSPIVNKAVGGAQNSQHLTGEAVDFICPGFGSVEEVVRAIASSQIPYDQIISEFVPKGGGNGGWCHISFTAKPGRKQALVIDHDGTRMFA